MKKLTFSIIAALLFISSQACPFCGCGGSNFYLGLLPDFQRGFIGMRYHYSQYHTTLLNDASQFSTNYYNMVEMWGGVSVNKKFQVLTFVPYYMNRQVDDDGITNPHGIGDISVFGQYRIFSSTHLNQHRHVVQQQMWIGAGLKLATGNFELDLNDPDVTVADINAQLGTGSTDFLLNGLYNISV
jgi:hypothetical protein